jgi:hypothetical protein
MTDNMAEHGIGALSAWLAGVGLHGEPEVVLSNACSAAASCAESPIASTSTFAGITRISGPAAFRWIV